MKFVARLLAVTALAVALFTPSLSGAVAIDDYSAWPTYPDHPARHAAAVTPSDGSTLTHVSRSLWVGTAGTICVDMQGGETNQCFPSATGWMPLETTKVYSTGTTASGIFEVW